MMFLLVLISCQKKVYRKSLFVARKVSYLKQQSIYARPCVFEAHAYNAGQDQHACLPYLIISFGV